MGLGCRVQKNGTMAGLATRDSKQYHCIRSGSTGLKYQALNKPLEEFWASLSRTAKRSKIKIKEGSGRAQQWRAYLYSTVRG